jgi:hypothetical protein
LHTSDLSDAAPLDANNIAIDLISEAAEDLPDFEDPAFGQMFDRLLIDG